MTGYGRGTGTHEGRRIAVEVRAVNGRAVEIKVRGRELDAEADLAVGRAIRERVQRGSLLVTVDEEGGEASLAVDHERLRALHRELEAVRQELGVAEPVSLTTLAAFGGERAAGSRRRPLPWGAVRDALDEALRSLAAMREQEGRALAADLHERLTRLQSLAARMSAAAAALPERAARRLTQRLAQLTAGGEMPDSARLAQEVALLAERLDTAEEQVRLDTHLRAFVAWLEPSSAPQEPLGRKMEFLIQEIGRELNTFAAKSQDAAVSALAVEAKAELEKIREQAQNIE